MAITFLEVKKSNPVSPKRGNTSDFLLDWGAVYSVAPDEELKFQSIEPTSFEDFMLFKSETIHLRIGNALFEFKSKVRAASVMFGEGDVFSFGRHYAGGIGGIS